MVRFDVEALRAEFPALAREQDGRAVAFLDGPGGTQVPQRVIDAVVDYYRDSNANSGGAFTTSELSDAMSDEAHAAVADFLGAASPDEIKFGYNMTTLTLHIGRSIGATLGPADEIVVTTLDHEANVSTWQRHGRRSRRDRADRRHPPRRCDPGSRGPRVEAQHPHEARGDRVREQRGRDYQSGRRDRRARPRGGRPGLRGRGGVCATRPDRRPCARRRLPGLLGLQVVRAAPRRPIRQG